MITQHSRIDYERIGDIATPLVRTVLLEVYGSDFCRASTEECLILMETVAFSLRVGGAFCDNLRAVVGDGPDMPCGIYTPAGVARNEGLKLLAMLQAAIVENYSILAAQKNI